MENGMNDPVRVRSEGKAMKGDGADGGRRVRTAGGEEVRTLMADVQDLLGRVAHVADPEIARVRAKVEAGLSNAKAAIGQGADRIRRSAGDAMAAGDEYVRDRPWQAVGVAAAAGLLVGLLVGRRSSH
jgi:ElaB/YqjD/DUF883 family membrane-anchored ribosome-binding protein